MKVLEPDPPVLSRMDDYRVGERAALLLSLCRCKETQLFFVPGFSGVGKTANLFPAIRQALDSKRSQVEYLPFRDNPMKEVELRTYLQDLARRGHDRLVLVIDDTPMGTTAPYVPPTLPNYTTIVKEELPMILKTEARVILVGGGFFSTAEQESRLIQHYGGLVPPGAFRSFPIDVKPLNRSQAEEALTGEATQLTPDERRAFADFSLGYLPPFLRILRPFKVDPETSSLRGALDCFCNAYSSRYNGIAEILWWIGVIPEGARQTSNEGEVWEDAMTPELQRLIFGIDEEAAKFLTSVSSQGV